MKNIALIDQNGWVDGVIRTECEFRETDHPNHKCVEIGDDIVVEIAHSGPIIWHDGSSFRLITDGKRIWQRLREQGFIGSNCREFYQRLVENKSSGKILGEVGSAPLSKPAPIIKIYPPIFTGELQPGLVYRPATEDDLGIFEQQMIKSGLYEKEKAWIQAAEWLSDPLTWSIITAWKNEIIQVEFYHFSNKEDKYSVWGGFASHVDRGRPHQFWSKFAIILFDAFDQIGIERMNTGIRTDIPEYIDFFKKRYGATELHRSEGAIATPLRYNIKDVVKNIDRCITTRKTLPSWEWKKGDVTVKEGTELDQELVKNWLLKSGSTYTPSNLHFDVLDKWWSLDQATLLLAFKKNELYDAWIIREREKELSGVYSFGFDTAEKLDEIREGMFDWQVKVGYINSSFFVGKAHTEDDTVKKLEAIGWKKEKDHKFPLGEQTEYRLNIKDFKK